MNYQLYPIPLCDVNLPVYYMVKSYFYGRALNKSADNLETEWQSLQVNCTRYDYLLFPSADDSQAYDADTLMREVIILKDRHKIIPRKNPKPRDTNYDPDASIGIYGIDFSQYEDDEDEYALNDIEPHETHYYIDTDPITGKLCLVEQSDLFIFRRDGITHEYDTLLKRSINKLFPVVQEARLGQGQWEQRLKTTLSMVQPRANALHILHNGGLYDIHTLEQQLSHSTISSTIWRPLLDEYTKHLKLFAMHDATRSSF